ncbi:hypothetical protein ACIBSW_08495 [Actinoplanes sp. NPDC049668]|uniref:hypothetical protein n=1 Tax=unclassified Actinoplanes TaxID=2626549 RepID=UPI0033A6366A
MSAPALAVGDRVTVRIRDRDPIELTVHRHAVIPDVAFGPGGDRSVVGHPPAARRYGPYPADRLARG